MLSDKALKHDRVLSDVEQRMLDYWLELDDHGNFMHPPSDDDELHEFIEIAFGVTIPRAVVEPGHSSPFQFVADCYFERCKNALAFASRNGGKTINVAVLNMLDMLFKPSCEIASAGAVKDQAKKCYKYFQQFLGMDWFLNLKERFKQTTGRRFIKKEIQEETVFGNGANQQILTATEKGLRSPHPHKARLDEVDEIEWNILQTGLSMARTSGGIRGQNIFTSTRQHTHGSMQKLLDKSRDGSIKVYEWNIWETVAKCERHCFEDSLHGDCPIYTYCKGKAHHCAGFYEVEDFIDKVKLIDRTTWETEWENKKPSRDRLVYSHFNENRHVLTPEKLFALTGVAQVSPYWHRLSGIDFGAGPGHPFVYVKLAQMPRGAWIVFFVYAAEQKLMHEHATAVRHSPFWLPSEKIYADTAGLQERMELKNRGIRTQAAVKDVKMGIDHVHSLLKGFPPREEPMLYVWWECEFVINEFNKYCWPMRADGKPDRSGVPKKENDHSLDAIRYCLFSSKKRPGRKYRARRMSGI